MLKKLIALLALSIASVCSHGASATFTADTTTIMPNPERGWYLLAGSLLDPSANFSGSLDAIVSNGYRLALAETYLPLSGLLTGTQLALMQTNFNSARTHGVKLIMLIDYGSVASDPALSVIQNQAAQYRYLMYANRDVIAYVKAGYIGESGEWADSASGNDLKAPKRAIKDMLMDLYPSEIPITFANIYPLMEDWYSGLPALNKTTAYRGSKQGRSGFTSDCFLTGNGDSFFTTGPNTVQDFTITSSYTAQRAYVETVTEFAPFITETCHGSQGSSVQERIGCGGYGALASQWVDEIGRPGGVMIEGPRNHLTSMNESYSSVFLNSWVSGGCFSEIERRMGYMFVLNTISHPDTGTHGTTVVFNVTMHNEGWGRIHKERRLRLRLTKSGATDIVCVSANDLRNLPSQTTTPQKLAINCQIPSNATLGVYAASIEMPDTNLGLSTVRAYSIRPANANVSGQLWNDTTGSFATGTTITVN